MRGCGASRVLAARAGPPPGRPRIGACKGPACSCSAPCCPTTVFTALKLYGTLFIGPQPSSSKPSSSKQGLRSQATTGTQYWVLVLLVLVLLLVVVLCLCQQQHLVV